MNQALHNVYILELNLLLSREKQLVATLPQMIALATDEDLQEAITDHLEETRDQQTRLERILANHEVDATVSDATCGTMQTLLAEAEEIAKTVTTNDAVRDSVIIAGARKIEHFEQAGYQAVIEWAEEMGHSEDKDILKETLSEEEAAADKLAGIAQGGLISSGVNEMAAA